MLLTRVNLQIGWKCNVGLRANPLESSLFHLTPTCLGYIHEDLLLVGQSVFFYYLPIFPLHFFLTFHLPNSVSVFLCDNFTFSWFGHLWSDPLVSTLSHHFARDHSSNKNDRKNSGGTLRPKETRRRQTKS